MYVHEKSAFSFFFSPTPVLLRQNVYILVAIFWKQITKASWQCPCYGLLFSLLKMQHMLMQTLSKSGWCHHIACAQVSGSTFCFLSWGSTHQNEVLLANSFCPFVCVCFFSVFAWFLQGVYIDDECQSCKGVVWLCVQRFPCQCISHFQVPPTFWRPFLRRTAWTSLLCFWI